MVKLGGDAPQPIVRETFVLGTPGALCAQLSASEANLARPTMPDADFAAFRSHAATPDDQKPGAPAAAALAPDSSQLPIEKFLYDLQVGLGRIVALLCTTGLIH